MHQIRFRLGSAPAPPAEGAYTAPQTPLGGLKFGSKLCLEFKQIVFASFSSRSSKEWCEVLLCHRQMSPFIQEEWQSTLSWMWHRDDWHKFVTARGMRGIASPCQNVGGWGIIWSLGTVENHENTEAVFFVSCRVFLQLPCFAVFFCNFVGLLTVLHSFLIIN